MRGFRLTVVAALALTLFGPRSPAHAADNPPEVGLGAGQLLIGTATAAVALAIPYFAANTPFDTIALATLPVGPAAVGGMVCTLGQTSKHYVGGCKPVVLGAYIGMLTSFPVFVIGVSRSPDGLNGYYGSDASIIFMINYALGTALGATIAWYRSRQERDVWARIRMPPTVAGAADQQWPELRWRPTPGARAATGMTVPLLAFTF